MADVQPEFNIESTTTVDGAKIRQDVDAKLRGASDDTAIGNTGDALHVNLQGVGSNNFIIASDAALEIALENVPGRSVINKFGSNPSIATAFENIWDGGALYEWATGAEKVNVVSDDSDDDLTGTGARTITLSGLDASYLEISETLDLDGKTNVLSTNSYLRLHRMTVRSAGTGGENAGVITAIQETSTVKMAQINEGNNQTLMALFTVPAGVTAAMTSYYLSTDKNKTLDVEVRVRAFGEVFAVKHSKQIAGSGTVHPFNPYFIIGEKSDIILQGKATTGRSKASGGFDVILVEDP